ncbi:MAG TPA: transcriptional regulator [Candidatus Aenigmarchaeota archaeon]|nr:transcriptional regulator [Candidatus Aenigmarchaeota archaeon]
MVRPYVLEHYKKLFKRILGNREMTINEIIEKSKLSRATTQRWIDILVANGFLKERWEGNRKYISVVR